MFFNMGHPRPLLTLFFVLIEKVVDISRTRARVVKVDVEHADNLTTTPPLPILLFYLNKNDNQDC